MRLKSRMAGWLKFKDKGWIQIDDSEKETVNYKNQKSDENFLESWECENCQLINDIEDQYCENCETPNHDKIKNTNI